MRRKLAIAARLRQDKTLTLKHIAARVQLGVGIQVEDSPSCKLKESPALSAAQTKLLDEAGAIEAAVHRGGVCVGKRIRRLIRLQIRPVDEVCGSLNGVR